MPNTLILPFRLVRSIAPLLAVLVIVAPPVPTVSTPVGCTREMSPNVVFTAVRPALVPG